MYHILVVSDGTGRTAEQIIRAALTQFSEDEIELTLHPKVRTEEQVLAFTKEAADVSGFIVYTIVSQELRSFIVNTGRYYNVATIDLIGPLLAQLAHQFAVSPSEKPGLFGELNKEYFARIEAMEFAFSHDDGQRTEDLVKAEIVLVGVSRTFKTPLSVFLAFKGWFVANVPIILDMKPPTILSKLPPGKVFGLTIHSHFLAELRRERQNHLGGATGQYATLDHIREELIYAQRIFERPPKWPIINVTNKPIEEIASRILSIFRETKSTD